MGKLIVGGVLLWWLLQDEQEPDAATSKGAGEKVSSGLNDATKAVDWATQWTRRIMTDSQRLGDAIERAGSVFAGGTPADEPDQSMGRTDDASVSDFDQVYSAEDPTSWGSAPARMF